MSKKPATAQAEAAAVRNIAVIPRATLTGRDALRASTACGLESAQAELTSFTEALANDPAHAMKWSDKAFIAAANVRMSKEVLHALDAQGVTVEQIRQHAQGIVARAARYPERSSSPSHNLMAQEQAAAWARLLDRLDYFAEE